MNSSTEGPCPHNISSSQATICNTRTQNMMRKATILDMRQCDEKDEDEEEAYANEYSEEEDAKEMIE